MRGQTSKANRWADHYTRKARQEGYAARSVYKLEEIQRRYRVIRPGDRVLDLGCAPGGWLQFAAAATGPRGRVLGIDLMPVKIALPDHVQTLVGDLEHSTASFEAVLKAGFDVVLSDMAPATTGNRNTDAARSFNLAAAALETARRCLKSGGSFVCKIFQGEDAGVFTDRVRAAFEETRLFKPESSRKASKEIFVIGKGRKQEA
jgi:23S rRNA (uridine2552-2'-O)-methyltransferase